ncbi:hypothetical protein SteCoe_37514 [Stentor coeruleus]|uniref:Uncharacterized protein n=1 Tax=Stentor coeruleus TaxID=5963 RepID=A0A1R2AN01_9CILI|nr:hypothetical protein SteCoe_37514 [Stentor coeruleus]
MENPFESTDDRENKTKNLWRFALYSMKTELVLYDLCQSLYWQSIIEVGIMLSTLISLLTSHSLLFFMHIIHTIRPYVAFWIIFKLPKTHLILDQLSDDPIKAQSEATEIIQTQFKTSSVFYSYYLILSGISAIFDLIALLYNLSNTGGDMNTYIFYVNVAWVFLGFDLYVLLWSKSLLFTFPKVLRDTSKGIANSTLRDTGNMFNNMMEQVVNRIK